MGTDRAKLNSLSSFNPQIRSLQRLLVGNASDVEMDGAGRILVPPPLRQFAGLSKDVVLVGQGAKFELWDDEKWNLANRECARFQGWHPAGTRWFFAVMPWLNLHARHSFAA